MRLYKLVPDATANQPPVIDRATLLEELASDEDLFREIIGLFRETGPGQLQAVRQTAAAVAAVPRLETEMAAVLREVDSILNGA